MGTVIVPTWAEIASEPNTESGAEVLWKLFWEKTGLTREARRSQRPGFQA